MAPGSSLAFCSRLPLITCWRARATCDAAISAYSAPP
jgi:hypothetical protein